MRSIPLLATLVRCVALACCGLACASGTAKGPIFSPAPPPAPNRSLVYVYRVDRMGGVGPIRVRLQGGAEFDLRNGEYAPLVARPGGRKLGLRLPLFGSVSRGWTTIPLTAKPGETLFLRVWAGIDEVDRGPQGRPDDFGAPGRGDRYAGVNVFGAVWSTTESERDIRELRRSPDTPGSVQ